MQLISCDIINFGKLSNEHMDFNFGLNACIKENGWGKSTLSAFLLAMFYGLSGSGKSKITDNEWMRYEPWQGGAFGGKVVFEVNSKRYRLERQFARKADTFHLYDDITNFESFDYSEKIGEELFGVNKESFLHTVFIGQNACSLYEATDDMNKKLGNITDAMDLGNYDKADLTLKNAIAALSPRKGNVLDRLKTRESDINVKLNDYRDIETVINSCSEQINEILSKEKECRETGEKLKLMRKTAAQAQGVAQNVANYNSLLQECKEKEEAYLSRKSMFPGEIPSEETIDSWKSKAFSLSRLDATLNTTRLTEIEHAKYQALSETFLQRIPTEEEVSEQFEKATLLMNQRKTALANSLTEAETIQYDKLSNLFGDEANPRESVFYLANRVNDVKELDKALEIRSLKEESLYKEERAKRRKKTGLAIVLSIAGLLCVLFGIMDFEFLSLDKLVLNTILYTGIGLMAVSLLLFLVRRRFNEFQVYREETISLINERDALIEEIQDKLSKKGILYSEGTIMANLQELTFKASEFERLQEKKMLNEKNGDAFTAESLSKDIREFLQPFSLYVSEEEYMKTLSSLKSDLTLYNTLKEKQASYENAKKEYVSLTELLKKEFLFYDLVLDENPSITVDVITEKHAEYQKALSLYKDAQDRLERFSNEHNMQSILQEPEKDETVSLDQIEVMQRENDEQLETLQNEKKRLENLLNSYQEKLDERNDLEDELVTIREEKARKESLKDTLSLTRDFLKASKDSLTLRYTKPLYDGFTKYYSAILPDTTRNYYLDAAANVTVEEQGLLRKTETLSMGYRDLIGFCMRLSSADAMFHDVEKPMIILDDPFVNLDNDKFAGALKLIEELAKSYQVLYFTCRNDRL